MKAALTLLLLALLASSAFAQSQPVPAPLASSCGPSNVKFKVKLDNTQHSVAQPEPGKALVYVIEVFRPPSGDVIKPTVRVGLDGRWVGANRASSYLFFLVDPGEHHLCASWQSTFGQISNQYSLTSFTAEGGKVYFFRIEPRVESIHSGGEAWSRDLAPVNPDEAQYLIANSSLSRSRPGK